MELAPEVFGDMLGRVGQARASLGRADTPFDVAVFGLSDSDGPDLVHSYAAQGATWWLESLSPMRGSVDALLAIVEAGPPRSP